MTDISDDYDPLWDDEYDPGDPDDEPDYWQERQDDLAMGYINEDGTQREPDEPDWAVRAEEAHEDAAHGGLPCNCPLPAPAGCNPSGPYSDEPPF